MRIDLGKKFEGKTENPITPGGGDTYYPTLYLESDELKDLPAEGVLSVRYRTVRDTLKTEIVTNGERKKTHCADLEVLEILGVEGEKVKKESGAARLDRLKRRVEVGVGDVIVEEDEDY